MGHVAHNAIIVTSWGDRTQAALDKARSFGLATSELIPGVANSYESFLVAPDGSKEGWPESEDGDRRREWFKSWLRDQRDEEGSSHLEWVEVRYGADEDDAKVVDHEWDHEWVDVDVP